MLKGRTRLHPLPVTAIVLSTIALAFLLSGCLWGVVKDASTDAPIAGASVTYTDSEGHTKTTTTNANGIYSFDIADGDNPAAGAVSFDITASGYEPMTAARLVEYNDNGNATLANLSSFWEIQGFNLTQHLVQKVEIELTSVDVDQALLAPPTPIITAYNAVFQAYDPADLTTALCENASGWRPITSTDPPPLSLDFDCVIPGDDFQVKVTVVLQRQWLIPPNPPFMAVDVSTAAYDWIAPDPDTSWQNQTLQSTDVATPDDPDLKFEAQIRFQSEMAPES